VFWFMHRFFSLILCTALAISFCICIPACNSGDICNVPEGEVPLPTEGETPLPEEGEAPPEPEPVLYFGYKVIAQFPHDPQAFTQGLQYVDGELFEGTGVNGQSSLRRVALNTGEVLQKLDLAREHIGEGITVLGEKEYQLTCVPEGKFRASQRVSLFDGRLGLDPRRYPLDHERRHVESLFL